MNTFTKEQITELGFANWLEETNNRGWFTCILTGKKFRGEQAASMLIDQQIAISEHEALQESAEADAADIAKEEAQALAQSLGQAILKPTVAPQEIGEEDEYNRSITVRLYSHLEEKALAGQAIKTTQINCEDCGVLRSIKVQDVFQVTRCVVCQKQHRNRKRAERRRQQRAEAKE